MSMQKDNFQLMCYEVCNFAVIIFMCLFLLFGCATGNEKRGLTIPAHYKEILKYRTITLYGGTGNAINDAIIVKGAINALQATEAIDLYLEERFPGYILKEKKLLNTPEGVYDCWEIFVDDKRKERIFFNISEFYTK